MAFEVISLGDGEMLYNAFQGAAMIFNPSNIGDLIKSGFIIGLLFISFRYIIDQQFQLRHALVAILVYMIMFVPKDDVVIGDAYSGEVRSVGNIPYGLSVPMSIVSKIGFSLTNIFETAFSTPEEASMMNHGYLDTLQTLIHLKGSSLGSASSSNNQNGNLLKSINHYIESCVMFDLEIPNGQHEVSNESLWKSNDLWAAMKTTFINRDVMIYLPNMNDAGQFNCKDAYVKINEYLTGTDFRSAWYSHLRGIMGLKNGDMSPKEKIDEAVAALSITGTESELFMRNALIASYLRDGPSAFIKRTAEEQLEFQWTGQQSVFKEFARPIMAFIEMFTVAASPIVAFLATFGAIGLSLLGRYFQLLIWIALWGPTMAICNLYITIVTTRALETLAATAESNGATIQSMIMHDQLFIIIERYLGIGGMLVASVPAISMMMVYGAGAAASQISSKLGGDISTSVNPKLSAPDPVSVSPAISIDGSSKYNPNTNTSQGTGYTEKSFTGKEVSSRQKQAAIAWENSTASTVTSTASKVIGSALKQGHSTSSGTSFLNTDLSSFSSSDRTTFETAKTLANQYGRNDSEKEAIATNAATELGLGGGAGSSPLSTRGLRLQGAINAALQTTAGEDAVRSRSISIDEAERVANTHDQVKSTQKSYQTSSGGQEQDFFNRENTTSAGKEYSKALQAYEKAQRSSSQVASIGDSLESVVSIGISGLSKNLVKYASGDLANKERELQEQGGPVYEQYLKDKAEVRENLAQSLTKLPFDQSEAIQQFGALLQDVENGGAIIAGEIFKKAVDPSHQDNGISFDANYFDNNSKVNESILSEKDANIFERKALSGIDKTKDQDTISPNDFFDDGESSSSPGRNYNKSGKSHHAITESTKKPIDNESLVPTDQNSSFDKHADQIKQKIDGELANTKGDHSNLIGRTIKNQGALQYDSTVKPVIRGLDYIEKKAEEGIPLLKDIADKSKEFFGGTESGSSGVSQGVRNFHNKKRKLDRDDLPPIKD